MCSALFSLTLSVITNLSRTRNLLQPTRVFKEDNRNNICVKNPESAAFKHHNFNLLRFSSFLRYPSVPFRLSGLSGLPPGVSEVAGRHCTDRDAIETTYAPPSSPSPPPPTTHYQEASI
ncbi:hypothetical protein FPQ18DRAFT_315155, partial [Pyronema domesticum]